MCVSLSLCHSLSLSLFVSLSNLQFDAAQVDFGANIGAFTLEAASRHLRVFAFEMQPWLYTALDLSVRASGYSAHTKLFGTALWDTNGATLSFNRVKGW